MFKSFFGSKPTSKSTPETKTSSVPAPALPQSPLEPLPMQFASSEVYLRERQERFNSIASTQELSNQSATKIGKLVIVLDKNISAHRSSIRAFKQECSRLPKQSMAGLESKVATVLPAIHRIELLLAERINFNKNKKKNQKISSQSNKAVSQKRRVSFLGLGNSKEGVRTSPRSTIKIRGMSEDISEDESGESGELMIPSVHDDGDDDAHDDDDCV